MADDSWTRWFTARTISFPTHARDAPERCLYRSNASGATQLYAWDRVDGRSRRLTNRVQGTPIGALSPDGQWVWWFDDEHGNEQGRWMRQPFDVHEDRSAQPVAPELPPGSDLGLALGRSTAIFALSGEDRTTVYHWREQEPLTFLTTSPYLAVVSGLAHDESLVAITHTEYGNGNLFDTAIRVLDSDTGATVGELWDGEERPLAGEDFVPRMGDPRLLVRHQREGVPTPMVWNPITGDEHHPRPTPETESTASWYPDASALVVKTRRHGRDRLHRFDLDDGSWTPIRAPSGSIAGYAARPDGSIEFEHSSGSAPPELRTDAGDIFLAQPDRIPDSVPLDDAWIQGPGGMIHALIAGASDVPSTTIVLLHGGPGGRVIDSFWPHRAAFVQQGYAVVHVNYRGSAGYGTAWEQADRARPGLIELEDVAAVRNWLVEQGITRPDQCVLSGISWGGYLTLLGLGTQPDLWAAGIADVPIGDLVALYQDEMEPVREADRSLFGGSPTERPEKWARSSPISYAEQVRAPLLVTAGRNDMRCPFRQVRNYLDRLDELGTPYELYEFEAGHMQLVVEEQIRQMEHRLDFLRRHLAIG